MCYNLFNYSSHIEYTMLWETSSYVWKSVLFSWNIFLNRNCWANYMFLKDFAMLYSLHVVLIYTLASRVWRCQFPNLLPIVVIMYFLSLSNLEINGILSLFNLQCYLGRWIFFHVYTYLSFMFLFCEVFIISFAQLFIICAIYMLRLLTLHHTGFVF